MVWEDLEFLSNLYVLFFYPWLPSCKIIVIHCVTALEVIRQLALQFFFFFFFLHLLSAYQWLQVYSAAAASVVMYARRYYTGKTARS